MTEDKHDLFLELEAFDPAWQRNYANVKAAAVAAGAEAFYLTWLATKEGTAYIAAMRGVPDTLAEIEAQQEALSTLPYHLGNVGVANKRIYNAPVPQDDDDMGEVDEDPDISYDINDDDEIVDDNEEVY